MRSIVAILYNCVEVRPGTADLLSFTSHGVALSDSLNHVNLLREQTTRYLCISAKSGLYGSANIAAYRTQYSRWVTFISTRQKEAAQSLP